MKYIRQYGFWIVLGILITILVAVAFSPAHHFTFSFAYFTKRFFALFLGIFYPLTLSLLAITPLFLVMLFIGITALLWAIWQLWRGRRYPMLILVTTLIGANMLFIGTGHFLDMGRVVAPIVICEDYRLSPRLTLQIVRYPIQARLRDDAQTFVLMSDDGGKTWRQILSAYTLNPQIGGCDPIEAEFNNDQTWSVILEERRGTAFQNDVVRYTTTDGGATFLREIE